MADGKHSGPRPCGNEPGPGRAMPQPAVSGAFGVHLTARLSGPLPARGWLTAGRWAVSASALVAADRHEAAAVLRESELLGRPQNFGSRGSPRRSFRAKRTPDAPTARAGKPLGSTEPLGLLVCPLYARPRRQSGSPVTSRAATRRVGLPWDPVVATFRSVAGARLPGRSARCGWARESLCLILGHRFLEMGHGRSAQGCSAGGLRMVSRLLAGRA